MRSRGDFNPRPTCVGRPSTTECQLIVVGLQSTPHMRGATAVCSRLAYIQTHFNPRPPCVGRREPMETTVIPEQTSIHAPYAWGDLLLSISYHRVSSFNPRPTCVGRQSIPRRLAEHRQTSIHAPHAWGDGTLPDIPSAPLRLQSTPHMRGATVCCSCSVLHRFTSIHAPHAWGDFGAVLKVPTLSHFNPRPTCVGRQGRHSPCAQFPRYFNPRPTCVGRPLRRPFYYRRINTSIHAPHAWGDGWSDTVEVAAVILQSTPHMRGATSNSWAAIHSCRHFNPRPTCVGRPNGIFKPSGKWDTSIHAPHAWGDQILKNNVLIIDGLQSTPHMRGATYLVNILAITAQLQSTPHMRGATLLKPSSDTDTVNFNPRPTCVGRQYRQKHGIVATELQSTPHMRGATLL